MLDPGASVLAVATFLANRSLREIEVEMLGLVETHGAFWFTTTTGISTYIMRGLATSSTHSPAEAAQIWGLGYLTGTLTPTAQPVGPAGLAGVVGEMIDTFLVNKGLT